MRAAVRTGILGVNINFTTVQSSPSIPGKEKDSLLVKVHAGAINPIDYKLPRSVIGPVVGKDFVGTVAVVGPECDGEFAVGDLIFGVTKGSLAEYSVAKSTEVAKAPTEGWKATDIAALPTAYCSALHCLRAGNILPDHETGEGTASDVNFKSILVLGASGGCGLAGVQLCVALGVSRIVAVCSEKNRAFVMEHGATEVVDYNNVAELDAFFEENQGKFDCVYDAASNSGGGEDYWKRSLGLLRRHGNGDQNNEIAGEYTTLNGPPTKWIRALVGKQKKNETINTKDANTSDLGLVVKLMNRIKARPFTTEMAFDEDGVKEAFELLKSRRTKGKIVFDISSASSSTGTGDAAATGTAVP